MIRLLLLILLPATLLQPAEAQAGARTDILQLVEAILTSELINVGGSALQQVGPADRNHSEQAAGPVPLTAETHPTPVAVEQEAVLPQLPPAPAAPLTNKETVRTVFGVHGNAAVAVSSCETGGTFSTTATNGQFLGLMQMGARERAKYGHGDTALEQAEAAKRYFDVAGWSPWKACR